MELTVKELMEMREKALKNLEIAKRNNNEMRIKGFEDQINRIDEEIKGLDVEEVKEVVGKVTVKHLYEDWNNASVVLKDGSIAKCSLNNNGNWSISYITVDGVNYSHRKYFKKYSREIAGYMENHLQQ